MSQTFAKPLVAAAIAACFTFSSGQAHAWALDFEDFGQTGSIAKDIVHGQVLNTEQATGGAFPAKYGIAPYNLTNGVGAAGEWGNTGYTGSNLPALTGGDAVNGIYSGSIPNATVYRETIDGISASSSGGNTGPSTRILGTNASNDQEYVIVFDTGSPPNTTHDDPDLLDDFGNLQVLRSVNNGSATEVVANVGGTGGARDLTAAELRQLRNPGNIAIVQEADEGNKDLSLQTMESCKTGICNNPDDEFPGDSMIFFEFDAAVHLDSIDVFDLETLGGNSSNGAEIEFFRNDVSNNVLESFATVIAPVTGNNGAARILFNGGAGYDDVLLVKITLGGSGGIDNLVGLNQTDVNVPEPATLALLGLGVFGLGFAKRRKA